MNYIQNFRIKVSSPTEAHIIRLPESLQILKSVIITIFRTLPQHWDLLYDNSNNQQITLHSEQDFQGLITNELKDPSKTIKVFIKEREYSHEIAHDPFGISEYHIIEGESKEINLNQGPSVTFDRSNFNFNKAEAGLGKPIGEPNHHQESNTGLQKQINQLQKKVEDMADLRKANSNISQLSKDSVLSVISEYVMAQNLHLNMPISVKQQQLPPQPQPQQREPKGKASEVPLANLMIGENTLEDLFQKMINKNIHNIASMTANILQSRGFQPQGQPQAQAQVVHEDARCHECGTSPIIGIKYKCLVCPDYELCEICESAHDHVHALVKIKRPGQQYKPPQEEQDGYSRPVSMVQSDYFEVPIQQGGKPGEGEEEKSSSLSQKNRMGGIKKSVKFVLEPEILEVIKEEEPKVEDKQGSIEEEENNVEKEEEKPLEIKQEDLLVSAEVKKVYSVSVIEKAKQLHQLLPEAIFEELLEFVNNSPSDVDVVELMERFQLL